MQRVVCECWIFMVFVNIVAGFLNVKCWSRSFFNIFVMWKKRFKKRCGLSFVYLFLTLYPSYERVNTKLEFSSNSSVNVLMLMHEWRQNRSCFFLLIRNWKCAEIAYYALMLFNILNFLNFCSYILTFFWEIIFFFYFIIGCKSY